MPRAHKLAAQLVDVHMHDLRFHCRDVDEKLFTAVRVRVDPGVTKRRTRHQGGRFTGQRTASTAVDPFFIAIHDTVRAGRGRRSRSAVQAVGDVSNADLRPAQDLPSPETLRLRSALIQFLFHLLLGQPRINSAGPRPKGALCGEVIPAKVGSGRPRTLYLRGPQSGSAIGT